MISIDEELNLSVYPDQRQKQRDLAAIKAVVLDVDGVLTDGTFWWGAAGEELKRFSFRDVMGVSRGLRVGLIFALISGEDSPLADRFARKMGITDVFRGVKDKADALRSFARQRRLALADMCFMGDDVNDVSALEIVGLPAAPADAHESARSKARLVTQCTGGRGAVRELVDFLLASRG